MSLPDEARLVLRAQWNDFETHWITLSTLQRAVLGRLIEHGNRFRGFDAAALDAYRQALGEPVTASDVQSALEHLRDRGLVVRLERGTYTLEDASMPEWFASRQATDHDGGGDGAGGVMAGGPR